MDPRLKGSQGDPNSDLWVIARDYGDTERRTGIPLSGQGGGLFNARMSEAGIRREKCFIHNVVPQQPWPTGPTSELRNTWKYHSQEAIDKGVDQLQKIIMEFSPRLIITLGNEALRTCMGLSPTTKELPGITECRGVLVGFTPWSKDS